LRLITLASIYLGGRTPRSDQLTSAAF